MNNSQQRFYLTALAIVIVGVLIATGKVAEAKDFLLLLPSVVVVFMPWERFRHRPPDNATEKRMTSRTTTRHSNR